MDAKFKLGISRTIFTYEREEWFIRITVPQHCTLTCPFPIPCHLSLFKADLDNEPLLRSVLKTVVSQERQLLMRLTVEPVMRYDITFIYWTTFTKSTGNHLLLSTSPFG